MNVHIDGHRRSGEIEGVRLDLLGLDEAMNLVAAHCAMDRQLHIVTVNINFLTIARTNTAFRTAINNAGLCVVDGRILLWMTRLFGFRGAAQVTGHDLTRECLQLCQSSGYRMFLLGGQPSVSSKLIETLRAQNPGMRIEGTDGGRFDASGSSDRDDETLRQIRAFAPHVLLVALGAPKQELWIARNLDHLGSVVTIGVGGVFDTLTGHLARAPKWMQVAGLESLFQLLIEPGRYWRRYVLDDPPTILRILASRVTR